MDFWLNTRRRFRIVSRKLKRNWKHYVFQSLLATVSIAIVLFFLTLENAVIIASIGASTFIVFAMPKSVAAKSKNIIGGHVIGIIVGSLCSLIPHTSSLVSVFVYAIAVGISIFIMVVVDMEHPPASGATLGVAITGFTWGVTIAVMTAAIILSLIHRYFKRHIKDLV